MSGFWYGIEEWDEEMMMVWKFGGLLAVWWLNFGEEGVDSMVRICQFPLCQENKKPAMRWEIEFFIFMELGVTCKKVGKSFAGKFLAFKQVKKWKSGKYFQSSMENRPYQTGPYNSTILHQTFTILKLEREQLSY
jgi:hypothetical protein